MGLFRYVERVKSSFPSGMRLDGMKVVIDCANGAGYRAAPEVLWELGADVIPVGVNPNGLNINKNCGSTNPQIAAEAVVSHGADVGICLDGDADRIGMYNGKGAEIDPSGPPPGPPPPIVCDCTHGFCLIYFGCH